MRSWCLQQQHSTVKSGRHVANYKSKLQKRRRSVGKLLMAGARAWARRGGEEDGDGCGGRGSGGAMWCSVAGSIAMIRKERDEVFKIWGR